MYILYKIYTPIDTPINPIDTPISMDTPIDTPINPVILNLHLRWV